MDNRRAQVSRWLRTISWHRRILAAALAAAAVVLVIDAASPSLPAGVDVVVAARDVDGGTKLRPDDLVTRSFPADAAPQGRVDIDAAVGRVLAAPVRAGEPLTDRRLLGQALLDGWGTDLVATPVRVTDAGTTSLITSGDRINVLAAADHAESARVIAGDVPVLTVTTTDDSVLGDGALLVVATTPERAADLAHAAMTAHISFTVGRAQHHADDD